MRSLLNFWHLFKILVKYLFHDDNCLLLWFWKFLWQNCFQSQFKQDRPGGRTGSSGPLQQKYDGVFPQCRRWTWLSRIFTLLDSLLQEVTVTEIQIATCLIRPSLHCLIHFSKRCVSCRSPVLSSLRLGRQGTQLEHPTHTNSPKLKKDYTGSHIHALGWTTPQRLFILRLLRRERCPKFKMTSQSLQCSSLWIFFSSFVICDIVSAIYV